MKATQTLFEKRALNAERTRINDAAVQHQIDTLQETIDTAKHIISLDSTTPTQRETAKRRLEVYKQNMENLLTRTSSAKLAKGQIVLKNIDYYIQVRDYAVTTPMIDYARHQALIDLVIEKLDALQKDYRKITGEFDFVWYSRQ